MHTPRIVETVTGATMAELCAARDAVRDADIVELRLDGVRDPDVAAALSGRRLPAIVTCRPAWEGGRFDGSEDERLGVLRQAAEAGAEYVDVEWRADWRGFAAAPGSALVLSHHAFDGTPADLASRVRAMRSAHDGIIKVAVTARRLRDVLTLREAVRDAGPHVAIAMEAPGQITRVWPAGFGSVWTYAGSAAPGQLPAPVLAARYRVRETTERTRVYAITGKPLGHSASPAMHNAALAAEKLDAVYASLETDDAGEAIAVAEALDVAGLSVTAPLKTALAARVSVVSDAARRTGAVNTLRRGPRGWEGENFDVDAFLAPLEAHADRLRGARAVVLGAGGAARAAVTALRRAGAQVSVSARRAGEASRLAAETACQIEPWPPAPGWTLLVNATPVGTWPDVDATPLPRALVSGAIVYDLVYNPEDTALLAVAREAGAKAIGGLPMLVEQARRQFEWWTGRRVAAALLERAAREAIGPATGASPITAAPAAGRS